MLQLVPKKFDWVEIGRFQWSLPPINSTFFHEAAGKAAGMFRFLILLEAMTVGERCSDEREQSIGEDLGNVKLSIHYSLEHDQLHWSPLGDSSPDMHFDRVFWFAFKLWLLPPPMKAYFTVVFKKN